MDRSGRISRLLVRCLRLWVSRDHKRIKRMQCGAGYSSGCVFIVAPTWRQKAEDERLLCPKRKRYGRVWDGRIRIESVEDPLDLGEMRR